MTYSPPYLARRIEGAALGAEYARPFQMPNADAGFSPVIVSPGRTGAALSSYGLYRFALWRAIPLPLAEDRPRLASFDSVLFLLANPSTADAETDDPTIRRCIGYARLWGHATLYVVNVNPYRSTDPKHVLRPPEPVLRANDAWIWGLAARSTLVVAGYGKNPAGDLIERALDVIRTQRDVHALEFTADGTPRHPLYLRADLPPALYLRRFERE